MRIRVFSFLVIVSLSSLACAASAMEAEALFPFEDQTTHLWGYRASGGKVVISPRFSVAEDFSPHGIAAVADASGWKYIDRNGNIVIMPFIFDNGPDPFQEGLARFKEGDKFGFFDERGRVVVPPRFDFAAPFSEGLAAFCLGCREQVDGEHSSYRGGAWGFIDAEGRVVIEPVFEDARSFEQGKAMVMRNGRWITIGRQGTIRE